MKYKRSVWDRAQVALGSARTSESYRKEGTSPAAFTAHEHALTDKAALKAAIEEIEEENAKLRCNAVSPGKPLTSAELGAALHDAMKAAGQPVLSQDGATMYANVNCRAVALFLLECLDIRLKVKEDTE